MPQTEGKSILNYQGVTIFVQGTSEEPEEKGDFLAFSVAVNNYHAGYILGGYEQFRPESGVTINVAQQKIIMTFMEVCLELYHDNSRFLNELNSLNKEEIATAIDYKELEHDIGEEDLKDSYFFNDNYRNRHGNKEDK